MTDAEVAALIEWEIKVAGGCLALMGCSDDQIVAAWLRVLGQLNNERVWPILSTEPMGRH